MIAQTPGTALRIAVRKDDDESMGDSGVSEAPLIEIETSTGGIVNMASPTQIAALSDADRLAAAKRIQETMASLQAMALKLA